MRPYTVGDSFSKAAPPRSAAPLQRSSTGSLRHGGGLQQYRTEALLDRAEQLGFDVGNGWLHLP